MTAVAYLSKLKIAPGNNLKSSFCTLAIGATSGQDMIASVGYHHGLALAGISFIRLYILIKLRIRDWGSRILNIAGFGHQGKDDSISEYLIWIASLVYGND